MLTALLLSAVALSGATPIDVVVVLPPEAEVAGGAITLGDVAAIDADDPALVERFAAFDLGYVPSPGYSRLLEDRWIGERLHREWPEVTIVFRGARATRVWPATQQVTGEALREAALAALRGHAAGADVSVEPTGVFQDVAAPAGELRLVPRVAGVALESGALSLPVLVEVDGRPWRTLRAAFDVTVWEQVPVLTTALPAGAPLVPGLFETRRRAQPRHRTLEPLGLHALVGAKAARSLAAGQVVTTRDVQRPAAIQAGASIQLQVRRGQVVARVPATARGTGALGDRIPVVPSTSGQVLTAVVIGRDLVEIRIDPAL